MLLSSGILGANYMQDVAGYEAINVVIQGILGSNSDIALKSLSEDFDINFNPVYTDSFDEFVAFMSSTDDREYLLVPAKSSKGGSVHEGVVGLAQNNLEIISEVFLKINHLLVTREDNTDDNLEGKVVTSHPQALRQCNPFLTNEGMISKSYGDTALAAKDLSKGKLEGYVICSELARFEYGGLRIVEHIPFEIPPITQFLLVKKKGAETPANLVRDISDYRLSILLDGSISQNNLAILHQLENWGARSVSNYQFPSDNLGAKYFSSSSFVDLIFRVKKNYVHFKPKGDKPPINTGIPYRAFSEFLYQRGNGFKVLGIFEMHKLGKNGVPYRFKEYRTDGIPYAKKNAQDFNMEKLTHFQNELSALRRLGSIGLQSPLDFVGKQ